MKKKVIILINSIKIGGAEKVVLSIAKHLSNRNQVTLITLNNNQTLPSIEGIKIEELGSFNLFSKVLKIKKHFKENEIVISFLLLSNVLTSIIGTFITPSPKTFLAIRNDPAKEKANLFLKLASRIFYKKATGLICQTEYLSDLSKNLYKVDSIILIPNFISKTNLSTSAIQTPLKKIKHFKGTTFLSVGTKIYQKGFDELIEVFSQKFKNKGNARLIIVGLDKKKQTYLKDKFLCTNIIFIDPTPYVEYYYLACDYYILNSRYEGFPNVVLEATSYNMVPIMKKNVSGVHEISQKLSSAITYESSRELLLIINRLSKKSSNSLKKLTVGEVYTISSEFSASKILNLWDQLLIYNDK